ncbi:MAG TPA: porin family protein, partial [Mucilaginibacter sp.]
MKKIHLLALFLLFAGSVSAQYYDPNAPQRPRYRRVQRRPQQPFGQVQVGLTAGLNVANTVDAYNSYYSTGTIAGFNAGLTLDVPIVANFSFAPEVLYSQKGYFAETTDGNFTQRYNFIDVPLLAKFKVGPGFNFLIGPQVSFLVSSNNSFDNGFVVTHQNDYNYNGNNTFIDGVIGVSFDITRQFDLHARYMIDLNQTSSNNAYIPDFRNQVWQFGFGI